MGDWTFPKVGPRRPKNDPKPGGLVPPGSAFVSKAEMGEFAGALLYELALVAARYDCLVDLLLYKGTLTEGDLDLLVEASKAEADKKLKQMMEKQDGD